MGVSVVNINYMAFVQLQKAIKFNCAMEYCSGLFCFGEEEKRRLVVVVAAYVSTTYQKKSYLGKDV